MADPTARPAGDAVSTPDAGEIRIYRQYLRAGRWPATVCLALAVAALIVGGAVATQVTIPAIGRLGTTIVRLAISLVPPLLLSIPAIVGPRGPFRGWFWPRLTVQVDDRGLAWWSEGTVRRSEDSLAWSAVATVGPTLPGRKRPPGADCALSAVDGRILTRLPCRLVRIDRQVSPNRWRRVAWLPDIAVAIRPDRYRRRRLLGRRATLRDPLSG